PWFHRIRLSRALHIVPIDPARAEDAPLYLVAPIVRNGQFAGAVLGAIDLAHDEEFGVSGARSTLLRTVLATRQGEVVYPPEPPEYSSNPEWRNWFARREPEADLSSMQLPEGAILVGSADVAGTDLVLMLLARENELFAPARSRFHVRLGLLLFLALV